MVEGRVVDVASYTSKTVKIKYPNFFIKDINPTTPLVVSLLEEGDIPLIGEHKGQQRVICYISDSAYNVDKILRTHDNLLYRKDAESEVEICEVKEYLEVISGWIL